MVDAGGLEGPDQGSHVRIVLGERHPPPLLGKQAGAVQRLAPVGFRRQAVKAWAAGAVGGGPAVAQLVQRAGQRHRQQQVPIGHQHAGRFRHGPFRQAPLQREAGIHQPQAGVGQRQSFRVRAQRLEALAGAPTRPGLRQHRRRQVHRQPAAVRPAALLTPGQGRGGAAQLQGAAVGQFRRRHVQQAERAGQLQAGVGVVAWRGATETVADRRLIHQ